MREPVMISADVCFSMQELRINNEKLKEEVNQAIKCMNRNGAVVLEMHSICDLLMRKNQVMVDALKRIVDPWETEDSQIIAQRAIRTVQSMGEIKNEKINTKDSSHRSNYYLHSVWNSPNPESPPLPSETL